MYPPLSLFLPPFLIIDTNYNSPFLCTPPPNFSPKKNTPFYFLYFASLSLVSTVINVFVMYIPIYVKFAAPPHHPFLLCTYTDIQSFLYSVHVYTTQPFTFNLFLSILPSPIILSPFLILHPIPFTVLISHFPSLSLLLLSPIHVLLSF